MRQLFLKSINGFNYENKHPCIYFLIKGRKVVYIGETTNMNQRIKRHSKNKIFEKIFFIESNLFSEKLKRTSLEHLFIFSFLPKYNNIVNIEMWGLMNKYKKTVELMFNQSINFQHSELGDFYITPAVYEIRMMVLDWLNKNLHLSLTKELMINREIDLFNQWQPMPKQTFIDGIYLVFPVNFDRKKARIF